MKIMLQIRRFFNKTKRLLFVPPVMLCCAVAAQNVSYNLNSVPIGGNFNAAFGYQNLLSNSGNMNTALGFQALYSNTTATHNIAIGTRAMYLNTTGYSNTALAAQALLNNTSGYQNTSMGINSLYYNTTGYDNTAAGATALITNTVGHQNTAIGATAMQNNSTGNHNTALGYSAGYYALGSNNVFIGYKAGKNETGNNKFYLANDSAQTLIFGDFSRGQLLLGKADPTGYNFTGNRTLNVLGGIIADSIRIALSSNWADYVFNQDYALMPLDILESYIAVNKRLPNMPSAAEVKQDGIDIGVMNIKLVEKIEELHLYIMQQQKQIEELKQLVLKRR